MIIIIISIDIIDCDNIIDIIYIGDIIETNDNLDNIDKMETSIGENQNLVIFVTYQQYVYQMKAEIILNSNLTSDHMICCSKLGIGMTFRFFI